MFNHCFVNEKALFIWIYSKQKIAFYVQKTCSLLLLLTKPPNSFEAMPIENGTGLGWIKAYTLNISVPAVKCQLQILLIYVQLRV